MQSREAPPGRPVDDGAAPPTPGEPRLASEETAADPEQATSPSRDRRGQAEVFTDHLRRRAGHYFPSPGGGATEVSLDWHRVGRGSAFFGFGLGSGPDRRKILIKVLRTRPKARPPGGPPKPSLGRGLEPTLRCRMEYDALAALYDHVRDLEDPRFDAVRVFDALPAERALIMELVPRPSLRDLLLPWPLAGSGTAGDPATSFGNTGAWLRMYHELSRPAPLASRHTRRDDFISFTTELTAFLANTMGRRRFFQRVATRVERAGKSVLPEELPLGLSHGDFAMRNVLVAPRGAVTVIDTDARWSAPIYEDIGHFLTDLKCNAAQVLSRGRLFAGRTDVYERAFLEGYFGGEVPRDAVRLYEIQACLDKWAARVARVAGSTKLASRTLGAVRLGFGAAHFRKVIQTHLRELPE